MAHSAISTPTAATTGTRCARKPSQLAEYFNTHPNITTDAGAVLFGDTVTITADGPWQHLLYKLTGRKWGNLDVENETGCGIVPYTYSAQQPGQRRAVGRRAGAAAVDRRSLAGVSLDRPSQRRLLLAVSGDHRTADVRRLPQASASTSCPTRSRARSRCRRSIANTRCTRSRRSCRPARPGHLGLTQKGQPRRRRRRRPGDLRGRRRTSPACSASAVRDQRGRDRDRRRRDPRRRTAASFWCSRPTTQASKTSCGRCLKSATRCRLKTIRSRSSGIEQPEIRDCIAVDAPPNEHSHPDAERPARRAAGSGSALA